ncbi:DeoR/GlpR family DNA-binding transcription regulator [Streptomyces luteolus]|uniref:Lactose phosphotransferase system repressor n=1 Tax=Streptomyces luteolus TaxID=3043615 RepID=A0ABT6SQS3_9ACTN|nr:DeoR/GlpR family DNA-binding transcription regulator [Streptomyces sp. B-S-A12]MDI3417595.1 DeoR/GlpR family DNA-binding transcription regulator [Streptomyces sp. B-S-A12]
MGIGTNGTSGPVGQRERQQLIRDRVVREGFVRADSLAEQFGVSLMTVHRDLDALQSQGWLRKVRGGATALPSAVFHGDVSQRMAAMADVKQKLAAAALELITPGQTVMIDESTTCLSLAHRLAERAPLTVITNSVPVIKLVAGQPGISLYALGGTFYPAYEAFLGLHTAEAAGSVRADTLFMSTTAISHGRCYHQSQETVHVKRALIESAVRRVLLVDHTKFARQGLHTLTPLTTFDSVIVDDGLPTEEQRRIRDLGVTLKIVRCR